MTALCTVVLLLLGLLLSGTSVVLRQFGHFARVPVTPRRTWLELQLVHLCKAPRLSAWQGSFLPRPYAFLTNLLVRPYAGNAEIKLFGKHKASVRRPNGRFNNVSRDRVRWLRLFALFSLRFVARRSNRRRVEVGG